MLNFADDTYPEARALMPSRVSRNLNTLNEEWVKVNNWLSKSTKSAEIIITRTKIRRSVDEPPPLVPGLTRLE